MYVENGQNSEAEIPTPHIIINIYIYIHTSLLRIVRFQRLRFRHHMGQWGHGAIGVMGQWGQLGHWGNGAIGPMGQWGNGAIGAMGQLGNG